MKYSGKKEEEEEVEQQEQNRSVPVFFGFIELFKMGFLLQKVTSAKSHISEIFKNWHNSRLHCMDVVFRWFSKH